MVGVTQSQPEQPTFIYTFLVMAFAPHEGPHTKAHYLFPAKFSQTKKKPSEHTIGLRNNKWASICAQFAHNTLLVVPNQQLSVEKKMYMYIYIEIAFRHHLFLL